MTDLHRFPAAALAIALAVGALIAAGPALAQKRLALVVGNNAYPNLGADKQLNNAISDARAVRDTLKGLGFEVLHGENLDRRALVDRLFDFTARLGKDDTAFFFFAGHGVSFSGANYLLPSDIPAPRAGGRAEEGRLAEQAIAETTLIEQITAAGARVAVVVLDACRDNPLQAADRRSVGGTRGLAQSQPAKGVFAIYSAGFGQTALDRLGPDDRNPNSVFTRAFVEKLKTPGLDLRAVATQTRALVVEMARKIGHDQFPAYYDQVIGGDVYLAGIPERGQESAASRPVTPPAPPPDPGAAERADFAVARQIGTRAAYDAFLRKYRSGLYADLARAERDRLAALDTRPPSTAAPQPQAQPAVTAVAPMGDATLLGRYGDWGAYTAARGGKKVCFVLAQPKRTKTEPAGRKRDPAYMFVTTEPAKNMNEVSVMIGYPFKTNSDATVEVGGAVFAMYTQNDGAWIKAPDEERRMVDAMRKGGDLTVTGTSDRFKSTDQYSLKGLAQALDRIGLECK
jgi:invasion protein IalB